MAAGIAPADQARVFDRFSRTVDGRDAARRRAIGLGLPLAKQFVEAHGGTIELQSEPGEGTTVTIRLPRTAEQRAEWPVRRRPPNKTMTILLADAEATEAFGRALAAVLRAGDVVALFGALGAGKTTLARGVLRGLGHRRRRRQPDLPDRPGLCAARHAPAALACRSLPDRAIAGELEELGLDEALAEARC